MSFNLVDFIFLEDLRFVHLPKSFLVGFRHEVESVRPRPDPPLLSGFGLEGNPENNFLKHLNKIDLNKYNQKCQHG
jgi:hypothetical protein